MENFLSVYFSSPEEGRFVSGNSSDMSHAGLEHLETIYVNVPKDEKIYLQPWTDSSNYAGFSGKRWLFFL